MKRSKLVPGGLFALFILACAGSQAAVQSFVDQRDPGPSMPPVTISATLTDPYPDAKPLQHLGYADFAYWYTAGPDWRDSTAVINDGVTASLAFTIDSPDPAHAAIALQTGFMVDRPQDALPSSIGRLDTTLRFFDSQSQLVVTYAVSDVLSDPFTAGYGHAVEVPVPLGQQFTVQAMFKIVQQGQYLLPGQSAPANERYLFSGFAVSTTPVPEPQAWAMVLGGLAVLAGGLLSAPRRARQRSHARHTARLATLLAGAALATLAATPAHADDALIASAALQITGLQYRLVDLDPDDGITPWVTFTDSARTDVELREPGSPNVNQRFDGLFPAVFTVTSSSGLAQAQRTGDGFTVHAELRRSDLDKPDTWPTRAGEFLAQRAVVLGLGGNLSLSAHTQLVIEGQLMPTVALDMSSLTNHGLIQNPSGPINGLQGRSAVYVYNSAFDDGGSQLSEGNGHVFWQQDLSPAGASLVEPDEAMPVSLGFGLVNTLGVPLQGHVAWGATVYTQVLGTVPEPQVLVLCLAGLGVLGAKGRRPH